MGLDRKCRWGVVGLGQIAHDRFIPGLLRVVNAELVAFADSIESRRDLASQLCGSARPYDSLDAMLANEKLDAIYVSVPTGAHQAVVEKAARAGVNILCEKPLASSLAEAKAMVRATSESGVRLMTAYMSRFGDVYQEACRILAAGEIGEPVFVEAHFAYNARSAYPLGSPGAWRWTDTEGGGPMLDIGIYLLFAIREILDSRVNVLASERINVLEPTFPQADTHMALFRTESGVPGSLVASFSHNQVHLSIYGTKGDIQVSNLFSQSPTGTLRATTTKGQISIDVSTENYPANEHYFREAQHFTNAILNNEPHLPSENDVLADMETIHQLLNIRS
jgi:predicted dehydrogenase